MKSASSLRLGRGTICGRPRGTWDRELLPAFRPGSLSHAYLALSIRRIWHGLIGFSALAPLSPHGEGLGVRNSIHSRFGASMNLVSSVPRRDTHEHDTLSSARTRQAASASWARFLWAYLQPFAARFGLLAALLFGGIGLQLLAPQLVRAFIDATAAHAEQRQLLTLAVRGHGVYES